MTVAATNYCYKSIFRVCSYGNSRNLSHPDWIYYTTIALGSLLLELRPMYRIGIDSLYCRKNIHYFGLNPSEITLEQAQLAPLLLVHGKWHNQGVWLAIARTFQEKGIKNPVFTVNLEDDSDNPTPRDYEILELKFNEIKELYNKFKTEQKIHLCGYSRGGLVAYYFCQNQGFLFRGDINRVFLLGAPPMEAVNRFLEPYVFRVVALYDLMVPKTPVCEYQNKEIFIPTGHLGLPFSEETHNAISALIHRKVLPQR